MKERILRVNLNTGKLSQEAVPLKYERLGGRALTSRILLDEVDPVSQPLSPKNKMILAPGLLGGTTAPCCGRLSIGSKSPLTGGIKEANVGGTAGHLMAQLGIKALIMEGRYSKGKYCVLKVTPGGAQIVPADELGGLGNYKTVEKILDSFRGEGQDKITVISIGQAGEMLMAGASIAVTDRHHRPSRHAARGGLGAVLGSKGVKAIVLDGSTMKEKIPYYHGDEFRQISRKFTQELTETKQVLTKYGTSITLDVSQKIGCLPTRNFSQGQFEGYTQINPQKLYEIITERGGKTTDACMIGCPIRCGNIYNDEKGNYLTSTLQYESIVMLGPNCGIGNWDIIATLNFLCDDYGLDTIEMGAAMGVVMEAGLLQFGDGKGTVELLKEVEKGTVLGKLIAQGAELTGRVLGVKRIPAVKGQSLAAYDPRSLKGTGVTYATSPMGADHTAGNALPGRVGIDQNRHWNLDTLDREDKVELSRDLQIIFTAGDCVGFCLLAGFSVESMKVMAQLIQARHGYSISLEDVLNLGRDTLRWEIEFNRGSGLTLAHDQLPDFLLEEKLPPHNTVFDIPSSELKEVFNF